MARRAPDTPVSRFIRETHLMAGLAHSVTGMCVALHGRPHQREDDMANEPKSEPEGIEPPPHNDRPTGRPDRTTGAGREATIGDLEEKEHDREHRSGYGGKGG